MTKNTINQDAVKEFFEREDVQATISAISDVYGHRSTSQTLEKILRVSFRRALLDDLNSACKGGKS